jgi:cytoskeletal protein CcmA (bactofilin family)
VYDKKVIMKRVLVALSIFIAPLMAVPVVFAQNNFRSGEVATLKRNETIDKDYFASGERVTLSGIVNGDVYLAGGTIIVDGTVNGDLLAAGGNINITGDVTGDIRVAGGDIQVDGVVGGNITTLGGSIRVDDDSEVSGSMVAGGGNIEVFGPIGKGITAGAGTLMIANTVGGDVVTGVGQLDLASNAIVNGELNYISEEKASLAQGASVSGQIKHQLPPKRPGEEEKQQVLAGLGIGWAVFKFLSLLVIGSLLLWAVPIFSKKTSEEIVKNPLQSLGIGFLTLIATPIAAIILMVTVVGLPLGFMLLIGYFFLLYIVKVFVALAIGKKILDPKTNPFLQLALGLLILTVVFLVPVFGGLAEFIALLLGLGALVATKRSFMQNLRTKKLI